MEPYIKKSDIIAEIEKIQNEFSDSPDRNGNFDDLENQGAHKALDRLEYFLNTLETKEVDLEKEIKDYLTSYHLHIEDGGRVVFDNNDSPNFMCDIRHIAKHFFEVGLKTQKVEE